MVHLQATENLQQKQAALLTHLEIKFFEADDKIFIGDEEEVKARYEAEMQSTKVEEEWEAWEDWLNGNIETADDMLEVNSDEDYFTVNSRPTKRGNSPAYYTRTVEELKAILPSWAIQSITVFVCSKLDGEVEPETQAWIDKFSNGDLDRRQVAEEFYQTLAELVKDKPVIKDWLYNQNILFWLLGQQSGDTNLSLVEAWVGEIPTDRRTDDYTNDGEYNVYTDGEADDAWDEALESYLDECVEGSDNRYFDRDAWKSDARVDGRGHSIARYDSEENEEEVNGTTYYIYKQN